MIIIYEGNVNRILKLNDDFLGFIPLFDEEDYVTNFYINLIKRRIEAKVPGTKAANEEKNKRYLQLLKLKEAGNYFSNEKMRERAPALFDSMVGQYLNDEGEYLIEKFMNILKLNNMYYILHTLDIV